MTTSVINKGRFNPISLSVLLILLCVSVMLYVLHIINIPMLVLLVIFSGLLASAICIADQWERAVVLRMGKYKGLKGPGPFMIIPIIDTVSAYIDQQFFQGGADAYQRCGTGQCGCGRVLDSLGCRKSSPGSAGIPESHRTHRPNRFKRHDRQT